MAKPKRFSFLRKAGHALFGTNDIANVKVKRVTPMRRMGVSGTVNYGGFIQQVEDKGALTGRERYRTYSEALANTAIIAAGVRFFVNLVSKADWKVEPAKDSGAKGEEVADQVNDILHDMETPWHRVVRRAAMYRFYGFSIQEWTAKRRDDGVIGLLDVEPRPQLTVERWATDEHGKVIGVVQRSPQTQEELFLPREKLVYLCDDTLNDTPEGLGLLRHVIELHRRLKRYEQLEGWAYETDMRGIPIGRAPLLALDELVESGDLAQADADAMVQELQDLVENHVKAPDMGMLLESMPYVTTDDKETPSTTPMWSLELLKGDSPAVAALAAAIERLNREIARVLGIEQLLLGSDSAGSFALSRDKSHNFALIVDGTLLELTEQFEKDILGPLFELNGWDTDLMPKLKTEAIQYKNIEDITSALRDMAQAGAPLMPHDEAAGEVYDLLGLTRPEREEMDLDSLIPNLPGEPEVDDLGEEETPNDPAEVN